MSSVGLLVSLPECLFLQINLSISSPFKYSTFPPPRQAAEWDQPIKPAFGNCREWYPQLITFSFLWRSRKQLGASFRCLGRGRAPNPSSTSITRFKHPPGSFLLPLTTAVCLPTCLCESGLQLPAASLVTLSFFLLLARLSRECSG